MAQPIQPRRGDGLALASALVSAVFLLAFREANQLVSRELAVFAMLACATLFNGGFSLTRMPRGGPLRKPSRATIHATVVLAALTIVGNIGVAGALGHLDPGLTSTVLQTQIFVVGLGGFLFLGERISGRFVVGAVCAVLGFGVLAIDDPSQARVSLIGVAFALLASLCFGGMLLYTRKVIARIDPIAVNALRLVLATLVLAAYLLPMGAIGALTPRAWLMVGIAAACGPFVARLCLMFALRHISASRTKLLTLLTPIFAFALEVAILGTAPSLRELVGAALILLGVVLPVLADRAIKRPSR